ncbi:hypothetical protein FS837_010283 [Tulasnella sp. UAMH 9824]|nr:hypothetical protein FS837_010283 [Tulasnella sp. UAMH 9824]
MVLFSFRARKSSPSHAETKTCATPAPSSKWASLKSRLSRRKDTTPVDTSVSANTGALIKIASNVPNLEKNLPPIPSSPKLRSPPDLPNVAGLSLASLSLEQETLRSRTPNPESSRLLSPDSRAAPSLSEYNNIRHTAPRANMLAAARAAGHQALPSSTEEGESVCYEARSSERPAPVSSSNRAASKAAVRFVEGKKRSTNRKFEPLELFIASPPYATEDLSACMSSATAAKSRRPHLRSQQTQSTGLSREPAHQSLAPTMRKTLCPTSFVENDVNARNNTKSAARRVRPPSSAAPVYSTSPREPKDVARLTPALKPLSKGAHESANISLSLHSDDKRNEPVRRDFPSRHRSPGRSQAGQLPTAFRPAAQSTFPARDYRLGATAFTDNGRTVDANESARGDIRCSPPAAPVQSKTVSNQVNVTDLGEDKPRTVDAQYASARGEVRTSPSVAPISGKTVSNNQDHPLRPHGSQPRTNVTPSSARKPVSKPGVTGPVEKNHLAVDVTNESARNKVRFLPSDAPIRNKTVSTSRDPRPRFQDGPISAKVAQSSVPAAFKKPRATDPPESNRRAADARDDESAGGEPRASPPAAPVGPTPLSHRKSSNVFNLDESSATPSVSAPVPQRSGNFKSWITSLSRKDGSQPKSSATCCPTEDERTKGRQILQNRGSNQRSGPHQNGQNSADIVRSAPEPDLSGAAPINRLQGRCALHPKGSSREIQALQANAQSEKLLAWFDEPVPRPHLNLGNDGIASETTVFTSKGPLCVSYVEEQLLSAGYSIGQDFSLTPIRPQPSPKTDKKPKLFTYFRKS